MSHSIAGNMVRILRLLFRIRSQASFYLLMASISLPITVGSEQYILDEYFDEEVSTNHQFRGCVDVRSYCAEIRHRCYRKEDQSWMYAHCPLTCNACHTMISTDVRFSESMTASVHSSMDVSLIRDAMGGDPMGVPQYLSSTTSSLEENVTIEQRSSLVQHIRQSSEYFYDHLDADCQNFSPYCTIWAVLFDRCNDAFYDEVMMEHCRLSCRRCHPEVDRDQEIG
jgi:ShK domain-like